MLAGGAQRLQRPVDVARAHARLAETLRELPGARLVGGQRGGDVERALVEARGLLVGELDDRALGGARGVVDRPLGAALGGRLQVVMGDLGEVRLELVAVALLQRLGDDEVQSRAAGRAEALQQGVAHERVGEAEAARIAAGENDAAAQGQLEQREHPRGDSPRTRASVCRRNPPPITAAAPSACVTGGSSGARRRRIASRTPSGSGSGRSPPRGVVQAALRGEQLHELVDEEGVARARAVDGGHELRRDLLALAAAQAARADRGELPDLVAAQPLQRQARRRAGEAAERRGELGTRVRLGMAVGGDRQQRHVGQRARDELERQQRRGVGPVQVVEDDDERLLLGGGRQQRGERVEEPEARLVGVQLGGPRGVAERLAELGQQAGDPGRAGAERGAQGRAVGAARERAADLHPRPVGRRAAAVPAAAPRPPGAARRRRARRTRARASSCRCPARR